MAWGRTALTTIVSVLILLSSLLFLDVNADSFPGTNGKIAFLSTRDGNDEIYTMNADGTGQIRLTNNAASDGDPNWSADGTKIVFASARDGNFEIYTMNADGTGQTNISNSPFSDQFPSWSPDGTKIAFRSNRDGNLEIYTMNADGTGQSRLTNNAATDSQPNWGTSGSQNTPASLTIVKNATRSDGAFDSGVFDFTVTNSTDTTTTSLFATTTTNGMITIPIVPDTYTITESGIPSDWTLTSSNCSINGVSQGLTSELTFSSGDFINCIFNNTKTIILPPPTIKITKNATNADGAFSFTIFNATNPSNSTTVNIPNTAINNMTVPLTVIPGNYSVTETVPAGWTLDASDCEKNSISLGTTLNFNVTLGDSVECIFINTKILAKIQGFKFNDTNQNGIQDGIEGSVEDIEILLFKLTPPDVIGVLIQNVSTAFDGTYNFTNLNPGSYRVAENTPQGTVQTFPANGQPHFIDILGTETITNINFGNNGTLPGEIRGMKFNDTNRNGIQDLGENGIPNIQFSIFPNYQTTFTDSNGNYKFKNLSPGTYSVYEQSLTNTVFTTPRTQTVVVEFNQIIQNVDFGDTKTIPLPSDMAIPSEQGETSNGTPLHLPFRDLVIQKTITACTPVGAPLVTLTFSDGSVRTNTMSNISGNLWETTFTRPFPNGVAQMRVDIDCPPDTANYPTNPANISGEDVFQIGDIVFYDPSGRVLDACNGKPLEGATTTLLKEFPPTSGNFIIPATADHLPVDNPQITDADGSYGWDVTPGLYKVTASKVGFVTIESPDLDIPPPVTGLDIVLPRVDGCPVFPAEGQRSDVNNFLTYSNPIQTTNSLPTGTTETTIVINYGPTTDAGTFKATLNRIDITSIFNPSPNTSEIVTIQLDEGRNTLNFLIDGLRTDGKTATDKDRLVFIVG